MARAIFFNTYFPTEAVFYDISYNAKGAHGAPFFMSLLLLIFVRRPVFSLAGGW